VVSEWRISEEDQDQDQDQDQGISATYTSVRHAKDMRHDLGRRCIGSSAGTIESDTGLHFIRSAE